MNLPSCYVIAMAQGAPSRGLRAILIHEKHTTENIDSRNCLLGVKNCTLIVGHRLFQQHRPISGPKESRIGALHSRPLSLSRPLSTLPPV
jgi:hypothetical protein